MSRAEESLRGSRVLVTGASSGLGRAVAVRLGFAGAELVLHGRDRPALESTARMSGGAVVCGDLGEPGEVARLAEAAGAVDLLISNAGLGWAGPLGGMSALEVS